MVGDGYKSPFKSIRGDSVDLNPPPSQFYRLLVDMYDVKTAVFPFRDKQVKGIGNVAGLGTYLKDLNTMLESLGQQMTGALKGLGRQSGT